MVAVAGQGSALAGHLLEAAAALDDLAACRLYVGEVLGMELRLSRHAAPIY